MSVAVKQKLKTISRATVERLLSGEQKKHKLKGKSTTKKGTLLKNQIPVRVFWAWDEKKPGFCEIDTVSHDGGGEISPYYAWTVTVTDVALGWTEVRALKTRPRVGRFRPPAIFTMPFQSPYAALTRTLVRATGAASSSTSILRNGATGAASLLLGEDHITPTTTVLWNKKMATWSGRLSAMPASRGTRPCLSSGMSIRALTHSSIIFTPRKSSLPRINCLTGRSKRFTTSSSKPLASGSLNTMIFLIH